MRFPFRSIYFSYTVDRVALAFYCLGALDLLGVVQAKTSETDRNSWREWIWEQQTRRYRFNRALHEPNSLHRRSARHRIQA
jgi:hypothetical protein